MSVAIPNVPETLDAIAPPPSPVARRPLVPVMALPESLLNVEIPTPAQILRPPAKPLDPEQIKDLLVRLQESVLRRQVALPKWGASEEEHLKFVGEVTRILREEFDLIGDELVHLGATLAKRMVGMGLLEEYLTEPGVEEIIVRGNFVQIERRGRIETVGHLADPAYFDGLAHRVAELGKKTLNAANPNILVDLPGNHRFTAIIDPLSPKQTCINIRVFPKDAWALQDLVKANMLTEDVAELLQEVVCRRRTSVLVSGKPGSGKTTLLNALMQLPPPETQIAVAEKFQELRVFQPSVVRAIVNNLRASDMTGDRQVASMGSVINDLYTRMRPDILLVGEVVNEDEARQFLRAVNIGVMSATTIHGNSVLDALYRLSALAQEPSVPEFSIRERIARGIGLGVHVDKDVSSGFRGVAEVVAIEDYVDDHFVLKPIYQARLPALPVVLTQDHSQEGA